jgi:hypothetical protein
MMIVMLLLSSLSLFPFLSCFLYNFLSLQSLAQHYCPRPKPGQAQGHRPIENLPLLGGQMVEYSQIPAKQRIADGLNI